MGELAGFSGGEDFRFPTDAVPVASVVPEQVASIAAHQALQEVAVAHERVAGQNVSLIDSMALGGRLCGMEMRALANLQEVLSSQPIEVRESEEFKNILRKLGDDQYASVESAVTLLYTQVLKASPAKEGIGTVREYFSQGQRGNSGELGSTGAFKEFYAASLLNLWAEQQVKAPRQELVGVLHELGASIQNSLDGSIGLEISAQSKHLIEIQEALINLKKIAQNTINEFDGAKSGIQQQMNDSEAVAKKLLSGGFSSGLPELETSAIVALLKTKPKELVM